MMTTAIEMYKGVLTELNRADTKSMSPTRFNYHAEIGYYEYLKMRYWSFDKHQKNIDDLQPLIVVTDGIAGNPAVIPNIGLVSPGGEVFTVPKNALALNEEMFMLQVHFKLRYHLNGCHAEGSLSEPIAARYRTHNLDTRNAYQKGNDEKLYYLFHGGRIRRVVSGKSQSVAEQCIMSYLRYPRLITVDNNGNSLTNPELGSSQNTELVRWIAASYLENIESLRQETMARVLGQTFTHQTALGQ